METDRRRVRIAILDDQQRAAERYFPLDELRAVCEPQLTVYTDHVRDEEELVRRAGQADVVVVMRERSTLSRAVIEQLKETKLIITSGAHNAAIDRAAAADRGIVVCGTRGRDRAPAELTWALLLALVRRIPAE
ncbi:MAG: D-2-hydroxyacid dehydrogenase family protein, partial [Actinophytocola sp.]|nr:D-2-hydroxyacid dehydrogenase family protein [Actinophytocola sp.]